MFRGLAAIVEAYLIYWALVYFVARRFFGFSREWAAPLASGISICGVSAAITTGAAIRARPVVPVMVSSLVVVFSVVELILLPLAARTWLADQPLVAAAWMGLAVKTDGAAVSSGAITQAFIDPGGIYQKDLMLLTTTTVKVFIDLFIGVWAFVLAVVWAYGIERKPGQGVPLAEIWERFPKFVFGYFLAFFVLLGVGVSRSHPSAVAEGGRGRGRSVPRLLLRDDVLRHRHGLQLQETVGRGAGPPGGGLRGVPVRFRDLDRPADLFPVFPRGHAPPRFRRPLT